MKSMAFFILLLTIPLSGQHSPIDSLQSELDRAKGTVAKIAIYEQLFKLEFPNRAQKINMGLDAYRFAKHQTIKKQQMDWGITTAFNMVEQDYLKALTLLLEIKPLCERERDTIQLARCLGFIGYAYTKFDLNKALENYRVCKNLMFKANIPERVVPIYTAMGYVFKEGNMPDSALAYLSQGYLSSKNGNSPIDTSNYNIHFGEVYLQKGDTATATKFFRKALRSGGGLEGQAHYSFALLFKKWGQLDSAKFHAHRSLEWEQKVNRTLYIFKSADLLHQLYRNDNPAFALKYLEIANTSRDSLFSQDKIRKIEQRIFEEKEKEAQAQRQMEARQEQLKIWGIMFALFGVLVLAFILYQNNRQKQKANKVLEKTLRKLESTQAQLIQSEKLASLGELTAGIAHEIQNPLNFVNNFAEVSAELLTEMQEELDKGDTAEAKAIADDLKSNLGKIALHGKRASSIVKGMLEHSRSSTGTKELSDLNQMADEYLRLAYHGLRAKDSSFSVQFETDLDPQMPKVEVIPQDLSRVLLNLINNAFYASNERAKTDAELKPMVKVSTRKLSDKQVEIKVQDNGMGVPKNIQDKIFQPFFTTKPTGFGTGLGLSLSYDIVTKGHGGSLTLESKEAEGATFIITLPIENPKS
jgi:signal transduction histidine kinase